MIKAITLLTTAILAISTATLRAKAFMWFNETGLDDIVANLAKSPKIDGVATVGETGNGPQTWSAVGHVNPYEESFGATYLSAYSIAARRRDILYGSFRASIKPPFIKPLPGSENGLGSGFEFTLSYNDSGRMRVNILTNDYVHNSTLGWSFAASRWDDNPIKNNLTYFQNFTQTNSTAFLEHRMEWLNKTYKKGKDAINLPTTPTPVSLRAWANGEPSSSQGPPIYEPNVVRVMYTRSFFNFSSVERHDQFVSQCAAAASSSNAACSTEDYTLRESTPFDLDAIQQFKPVKVKFSAPIWAVIIELFFLIVLIITVVHGLYIRKIKEAEKKRKASRKLFSSTTAAAGFEKPYKQIWAVPELIDDWGSDGESKIDEDDERFWDVEDQEDMDEYKFPPATTPSSPPRNGDSPCTPDTPNDAGAGWDRTDFDVWDVGVHPNCYNSKPNKWNDDTVYKHQRPRTSAWFFVMSIFILADRSSAFR
ncbi:uncharacterized protein UHOD_11475 [Ustilago sp. UG-2017b]|nr:uncharacterized protein UHOD_11475 [Ustilago sp. UG-2017b]